MKRTKKRYDFEDLRERFLDLSDEEVAEEYMNVLHQLNYLATTYSFSEIVDLLEPLEMARDFLGNYLAMLKCSEIGLIVA